RDLLERPALAEIGDDRIGLAAVGVGVEDAAVLVREHFRGGEKTLRGEQARHEAGKRAAALVELDGRRAPVREGAGGLAAGEAEGVALPLGIEAEELARRGGAAERTDHARRMPATRAKRGVLGAKADAHG